MVATRDVRIANCSGFYGDRMTALAEMVAGGPVDVITGDYLAEVTMLVLAKSALRNPAGGYATTWLRQFEPVASTIAERGIKVVVNAGGLAPASLAAATREVLDRLGLDLKVAHVEGDDLVGRLGEIEASCGLDHLDSGMPYRSWGSQALTANAYLGGFGITAALAAGADIVVTGRVADASLVVGAAAWWWGWDATDLDALAGAVIAGHVIECGTQATGGNFSGFAEIGSLDAPGFPLAEIAADGSSVITKHQSTGGVVSVDTVTAQLLYEIGPPAYLNPDVVARMDTVTLASAGRDRVSISGARGEPAPPSTKVAITGLGGWQNSCTAVITGLQADAKVAVFESAVRQRLADKEGISDLAFTRIGAGVPDADDQMLGSCLVHVSIQGNEESAGREFSSAIVELALGSYPGLYLTSVPSKGSAYGSYWPTLVPQSIVEHAVVHADGRRAVIAPPSAQATPPKATPPKATPPTGVADRGNQLAGVTSLQSSGHGATRRRPLGDLVQARSGDKGGNANLGVWVGNDDAWRWLKDFLTIDLVRELLPETDGLGMERYELANLRALNFVITGLLDGGATEARRYDKQAKALGEWLRSRCVEIPDRVFDRVPSNALDFAERIANSDRNASGLGTIAG